jgi:OmpA-OmpF porin, OOP family
MLQILAKSKEFQMFSITIRKVSFVAMVFVVIISLPIMAQNVFPSDAKDGADHPMLKRFNGSVLIGYKITDWDQTVFPVGKEVDDKKQWKNSVTLEGKITRLFYLAPQGKSRLEVYRNYEKALIDAGMQAKFNCDKDCNDLYFAWDSNVDISKAIKWSDGSIPTADGNNSYAINSPLTIDGRFLYGTINHNNQDIHVLIYNSVAQNDNTDITATYIEIVEPKPMQTNQVAVDANAMQAGLQTDGKMALYGIFFDTGKAEIKPESKPQLDEMAKLLNNNANLKVYIVGHTDNQGTLELNLALSQKRTQAVVAKLSGADYKVNAKRMVGRGIANLAPLASNASEEGRARNRRVELVLQ